MDVVFDENKSYIVNSHLKKKVDESEGMFLVSPAYLLNPGP
jgi:hypothetical protein